MKTEATLLFVLAGLTAIGTTQSQKVIHGAGLAAQFDGINDYYAVTPNCGADVGFQNDAVTLMAWVNISAEITATDK